jgi:hypothetical protein
MMGKLRVLGKTLSVLHLGVETWGASHPSAESEDLKAGRKWDTSYPSLPHQTHLQRASPCWLCALCVRPACQFLGNSSSSQASTVLQQGRTNGAEWMGWGLLAEGTTFLSVNGEAVVENGPLHSRL